MKPVALVATTTRWFPTARLALSMARAGFAVEAVCPSDHPLSKARIPRAIYPCGTIASVRSFASAIQRAAPEIIVAGDDLAARHLYRLYQLEVASGNGGSELCRVIERSVGSAESYPILFARAAFLEIARKEGVRGPKTAVLNSLDDLKAWVEQSGFPVVLKADGTSGGDGVKIVHSMREAQRGFRNLAAPPLLARAIARTLRDRDTTLLMPSVLRRRSVVNAQEFAPGREATSAMACWNGTVLACLNFEVIQKAQSAGHATVVRLTDNAEMLRAANRVARVLRLSGLHGLDFMVESNGQAHLIEINPRSTQVGHLALGAGRDLPAALYAAVSGEPLRATEKITENDTIALFPQEWIRDATSPLLRSAYHDVPWQEPELIRECVLSRQKQSRWYGSRVDVRFPGEGPAVERTSIELAGQTESST